MIWMTHLRKRGELDFDLEAWMASGLSGQFSQQVAHNQLAQNLAGVKAQFNDWSTWQQLLVDQANKDWQVLKDDFLLAHKPCPGKLRQ